MVNCTYFCGRGFSLVHLHDRLRAQSPAVTQYFTNLDFDLHFILEKLTLMNQLNVWLAVRTGGEPLQQVQDNHSNSQILRLKKIVTLPTAQSLNKAFESSPRQLNVCNNRVTKSLLSCFNYPDALFLEHPFVTFHTFPTV